MRKNLTLTIDEAVLKAARRVALDRDTTVNRLVQDYLARLVDETDRQEAALAQVREIFRTTPVQPAPRKWTRDELHER